MHTTHLSPLVLVLFSLVTGPALCAQSADESSEKSATEGQTKKMVNPISRQRVETVIQFLASDAMLGRDTPSPGLETAAAYIAKAFKKAGLKPGGDQGSYFHTYQLPSMVLDPSGIELTLFLAGKSDGLVLKAGQDVRLYRGAGSQDYLREDSDVIVVAEAEASRRLRRSFPRNPVLITVDEQNSPLWRMAAGKRRVLKSRRRLSRTPIFLVRKAAMPEGEIAHVRVKVPAAAEVSVELKNVVGFLPGQARKGEYVMFSSHYDHVGVGLPVRGDGIFNGADDDATGTTAVVTLAEAFAKHRPKHDRSLMFVCFSGEEKGLLGSRAFAENPPIDLNSIAANLNLEMVGRPDQIKQRSAWITGRDYSDFEAVAKIGFARAGIECVVFPRAMRLFNASDNASLARKGVIAHSISAGSMHEDYHQPTDHVDKLDLENMHAVIHGIYEAGLEFANRSERLTYNDRGRRVLRLDRKKRR